MFIATVYIRFYRSFNFDYLRKAHARFTPDPWDELEGDGRQYPFVRVPLEDGVTTVVGANESGKSQLLSAIKHALTGRGIERGDFCRYSQFFAVDKSMAFPDFGLEIKKLDEAGRQALAEACDGDLADEVTGFHMFRISGNAPVVYIQTDEEWAKYDVHDVERLHAMLPRWFKIDPDVALPESVPLRYLADGKTSPWTGPRKERQSFVDTLFDAGRGWFSSPETVQAAAAQLSSAYTTASQPTDDHGRQLELADDLLFKVAKVDRTAFQELKRAVSNGSDGFANGIVEQINRQLAASLNFPKWWSQDHQFQLLLTLRDQDLVFTIRDRTGTEYSAEERSGGLKYFLSYFVQYLAHEPPEAGGREVLLMDEPDAYLSASGQQDLLRIFEDFANPQQPDRAPCQVVYVTHSPFLIDKNHGDRIRVLEKGEGDEGTRVVRNAARNHYEPLRSAFGSFVGETTFISNCNLMLEGMSDQVLLAGMTARLRQQNVSTLEHLDLNTVTLVPAGSAAQIPYLVYLARGRDVDRPAVIVLLDSDSAGNQARTELNRGPNRKRILDPAFILQLGDLPGDEVVSTLPEGIVAIEDLIPLQIGLAAVKKYADDFLEPGQANKLRNLKTNDVNVDDGADTHAALQAAARKKLQDFHLDKVGFARSVLDIVRSGDAPAEATAVMEANFRVLFRRLASMQRQAEREIATEKTGSKIKRLKRSFLLDHPSGATRQDATLLLEEIEAALDNSLDAEDLKSKIRLVKRNFALDNELTEPIEDYASFRDALDSLVYSEVIESQET